MQEPQIIEHEPYFEEKNCVIREYFSSKPPQCARCRLRPECERDMTEEERDVMLDGIRRQRYRREFWEAYEEDLYA